MLKRVLFRAAALVAAMALGGSARADFVIDDFTTPNPNTGLVAVSPLSASTRIDNLTSQGTPTRSLTVSETANGLGTAGATSYLVGNTPAGGRLALATAPLTTANIQAQYTYASGQNLAAGGTSIQFTFASADFGVPYSIQLTDSNNITATQSGTTTTGGGVYAFSTDSFLNTPTGPTGLNLNAITSIILSLNRNLQTGGGDVSSADFTLSDVRVLTPTAPPPVPAPPAAVLVLAALPVLGLARARRLLPV